MNSDKSQQKFILEAVFIGLILSICFYGVMLVQTLVYFNTFKKDPTWRKCLVGILFILDSAKSMIDIKVAYNLLIVPHSDNAPHPRNSKLLFPCNIILTVTIVSAVQLFFTWRIQVLTSRKWFTSAIAICALSSFSLGVASAIAATDMIWLVVPNRGDLVKMQHTGLAWFVFECLTNLVLTVTLVLHLKNNKTGFKDTDDVIEKIIRITVPTGMINAISTSAFIILFYVDGHHLTEFIVYFSISKLYTNSMLTSLNSRRRLNHDGSESSRRDSNQLGSALQIQERTAEAEGHQVPVAKSNKGVEVFVQVDEVVDSSRGKMPIDDVGYYARDWESLSEV